MQKRDPQKRGPRNGDPSVCRAAWASLIAGLFVIAANSATPAAAATCLPGPGQQADPGTRWHYRIDHASHRRCWYMKPMGTHASRVSRARSLEPGTSAKADSQPTPDSQPTLLARISSAFAALAGQNTAGSEQDAVTRQSGQTQATRKSRGKERQATKRVEPEKTPARSPQPSSPQLSGSSTPASAPTIDADTREALYQEFLQWRIQQLVAPQ